MIDGVVEKNGPIVDVEQIAIQTVTFSGCKADSCVTCGFFVPEFCIPLKNCTFTPRLLGVLHSAIFSLSQGNRPIFLMCILITSALTAQSNESIMDVNQTPYGDEKSCLSFCLNLIRIGGAIAVLNRTLFCGPPCTLQSPITKN